MSTLNNISPQELETIELFLNGKMEKAEALAFQARMEEDDAFAKKVADTKVILTTIETESLRSKLNDFHSDIPTKEEDNLKTLETPKRSRSMVYAIAASVIVLFSLFFIFQNDNSVDKLFAKHFIPDPGLPTVMSTGTNYLFSEAMVDYKMGNYKAALRKWESQLPQKPNNDTLNYFIGVAQLANGDSQNAIPYLKNTIDSNQNTFKTDAHFYLGLAMLKEGNKEEATKALKKSNLPQAQELLQQLKK